MDSSRPLGDGPDRSYAGKLERFAHFIAPELKRLFATFGLEPDARVLDVGCGVGVATRMFAEMLGGGAHVVGLDLSLPHLAAARAGGSVDLVQADAAQLCFREATFDLVWSCNTLNHLPDPVAALRALRATLRPQGRLMLAQSGLLPEMYFAWDERLDDAVRHACHEYYRERYGLAREDTAGMRAIAGLIRRAGFRAGDVRTMVIERVPPLADADRAYFEETIFRGTWGERLKPFLSVDQWDALCVNVDPASPRYCLDRSEFHHLQTLTVCVGHA